MTSKALCFWIRITVITVSICGLFICGYLYPFWLSILSLENTNIEQYATAWWLFLLVVSIPCYVILFFVWRVSTAVKNEKVFTLETANMIKFSAQLLFADLILLLTGNMIFAVIDLKASILQIFCSLLLIIAGFTLAVFAAILSSYLIKAADLQETSEGTI